MTRHWDDIGYTAVVTSANEASVEFKVFVIAATNIEENGRTYPRAYERLGSMGSFDTVEHAGDEANVFLHGHVKWDGCSNWAFDNGGVMLHFCAQDEAVAVGTLFARLYAWAREMGMDRL